MPSIDNSFLSIKAPSNQDGIKSSADVALDKKEQKPFDQYLQDEICQEQEEPVVDKVVKQAEELIDDLPEIPMVTLADSEAIEESDILLSGNKLPVESLNEEVVAEIENLPINTVVTLDKVLPTVPVKEPVSLALTSKTLVSAENDLDLITTENEQKFETLEEPIIKIQKQLIDGQLNTKVELPVNDSSKVLKMVQIAAVNVNSTAEVSKNPIELSTAATQITTPVNNKQWGANLSQRVSVMLNNGQQVAELRLNPAHLGSVSIRLQLDEDQANISFVTQNQAVKEAIELSLPKLRDQLQQQGLELAQVDIENKDSGEASENAEYSEQGRSFNHENDEIDISLQENSLAVDINTGLSVFV